MKAKQLLIAMLILVSSSLIAQTNSTTDLTQAKAYLEARLQDIGLKYLTEDSYLSTKHEGQTVFIDYKTVDHEGSSFFDINTMAGKHKLSNSQKLYLLSENSDKKFGGIKVSEDGYVSIHLYIPTTADNKAIQSAIDYVSAFETVIRNRLK